MRGLSLAELRPWITGEEGSVVTLSFEGPNVRYDTSVVRGAGPGPRVGTGDMRGRIPPYGAAETRERPDDVYDFDRWRQDPLYNPASDDWHQPPAYDANQGYIAAHGCDDEPYDSVHSAPTPHTHYPGGSAQEASRLRASRRATSTSWAVEADKILAQAQAKIEDALQRERLLQETLDMLREKNASKMWDQKDTRMRLETQRDRLKADLEEERERFRCERGALRQKEWAAGCIPAQLINSLSSSSPVIVQVRCDHDTWVCPITDSEWCLLGRMETRSREAIEAELRKSEERLFMLTAHADRDQGDGALF